MLFRSRVFVGTDANEFYALDADSGRTEWKWRVGGDVIGAAVDAEDHVFIASLDNLLRSVNRGNGNQRWRRPIPARPAVPPRAIKDVVLLTGVAPQLTLYAAKDGREISTFASPAELEGAPLVDGAMTPFKVAIVVITREGQAIGLFPVAALFREPPTAPLQELPGTRLGREPSPAS